MEPGTEFARVLDSDESAELRVGTRIQADETTKYE